MSIRVFKDFEGDELNVTITSAMFIEATSHSTAYSHQEAIELANWILKTVEEKKKAGITIDHKDFYINKTNP